MFYVWLMLAGGFGVLLRYLLGRATTNLGWTALPFGTLFANLIGCFLIGYLSLFLAQKMQSSEQIQVIVIAGFLGGFTTFSAFSLEAVSMFNEGSNLRAIIYISVKVMLCVLMTLLGLMLAKQA